MTPSLRPVKRCTSVGEVFSATATRVTPARLAKRAQKPSSEGSRWSLLNAGPVKGGAHESRCTPVSASKLVLPAQRDNRARPYRTVDTSH